MNGLVLRKFRLIEFNNVEAINLHNRARKSLFWATE
jgi:hypothetical protein